MSNINSSFFDGSYKEVWKNLIPKGLTEAEVEFISEVCNLVEGDAVIDLMCGYGRHALELARRGMTVTAIDNAKAYIEEINAEAASQSLNVTAVADDLETMEISGNFKAAICMGNSFAFFNKESATAILKRVAASLLPGGVLVINSWMIAEIALKHFQPNEWYHAGPFKCVLEYRHFNFPSRLESEQTTIAPDGSIEVKKAVDYLFTLDELDAMFLQAGLKTSALYSTPRKRPFNLGDSRIYIVAQKVT